MRPLPHLSLPVSARLTDVVTFAAIDRFLLGWAGPSSQLLCNPDVLFAGYRSPHPLEPHFLLKIQTTPSSTPIMALRTASYSLLLSIQKLKKQVVDERARVKLDLQAAGAGAGASAAVEVGESSGGWSFAGTQGQGSGWGLGGDMDF